MIWSNIPQKFSVILWMHWGPLSSHYFLCQAQGTHQWCQTKLVKLCPCYHFNFPAFSCNNEFWFDSVYTFGLVQFCTLMLIVHWGVHWGEKLAWGKTSVFRSGTTGDFIYLCCGEDVVHSQQSSAAAFVSASTATKLLGSLLFWGKFWGNYFQFLTITNLISVSLCGDVICGSMQVK